MRITTVCLFVLVTWSTTANATLIDRGNGMIYDDVLDITWLSDANFGAGSAFDDGIDTTDGRMCWVSAAAWADSLLHGGFDDWRLPSMDVNLDSDWISTGSEGIIDCSVASEADCRDNELGYMYYYNLSGTAGDDLTGDQGLFTSIQSIHHSGTEFIPSWGWVFDFEHGEFDTTPVGPGGCVTAGAWAVRDGDVAGNDTDGDGILDTSDNCIDLANPAQRDTDGDDIGNICDPDVAMPNDCTVNFLDLQAYKNNFFMTGDLDTDNNGDGITNFIDLEIMKGFFFGPPGPSAYGCLPLDGEITATADGTVGDNDGDGTFDSVATSEPGLIVLQVPGTIVNRAVMEFDISAIPTGATINSVALEFEQTSFTSNSTAVNVMGYVGDGSISLSDATDPATLLTTFDAAALGLGQHSVELGPEFLQSLLGTSDFMALRLEGGVFGTNVSIAALEFVGAQPPKLRVSFSSR